MLWAVFVEIVNKKALDKYNIFHYVMCIHLFVKENNMPVDNSIDVFSVRDLRNKSSKYLKDAENGFLSIVTKHGKPAILSIPFDKKLIYHGVDKDIAISLFEKRVVPLTKAAKIASLSVEDFLDLLAGSGIDVVNYSTKELDKEMEISF